MTANTKRIVHNTRERVLSTDMNNMQALLDAQIANTAVAAAARGSGTAFANEGISGILDGFAVLPDQPGLTSVVRVSAGIAYKVGTPNDPNFDSRYIRIESDSDLTLDLQPFRAAQPRWVCVGMKAGLTTVTTSSRDVWQPALGTFQSQDIPKVVASLPELTVELGAPAAAPALPDGAADTIPLAYVYLDALPAGAINTTDLVLCRPLYSRINPKSQGSSHGGGVEVASFGSTSTRFRRVEGSWGLFGNYSISSAFVIDINDTDVWESGLAYTDLTGNNINRSLSFFACAPPWPPGHDLDIVGDTREFLDLTTRFAGSGLGFTRDCVVCVTYNNPTSPNHLGPRADITLADPIWGNGGTVTTFHYVGSTSYIHAPVQGVLPQIVDGSDVYFAQPMATPGATFLVTDTVNNGASATPFDPTDVNGDGKCYPPFTRLCDVGYFCDVTSGALAQVAITDDSDPGNVLEPYQWVSGPDFDQRGRVRIYSATQAAQLSAAEINSFDVKIDLYAVGYRDPYLSQR